MKSIYKHTGILLFFATVLFSSCKKDHEIAPDPENPGKTQSKTEDLLMIDNDINSIDKEISDAEETNSNARISQLCFNVQIQKDTLNPVPGFENNYRKFTLAYSGGNCDSLERKGQITVYKSGSFLLGNYRDSVVFDALTTNGRTLTGYRTYKFSSAGLTDVAVNYSVNIQTTFTNGNFVHINSEGKKKYVNFLTKLFAYYETSGKTSIVDQNGDVLNVTIDSPIIRKEECGRLRFPVEGKVSYVNTRTNNSVVVDYGPGTCDRSATLISNGGSPITIYLR